MLINHLSHPFFYSMSIINPFKRKQQSCLSFKKKSISAFSFKWFPPLHLNLRFLHPQKSNLSFISKIMPQNVKPTQMFRIFFRFFWQKCCPYSLIAAKNFTLSSQNLTNPTIFLSQLKGSSQNLRYLLRFCRSGIFCNL